MAANPISIYLRYANLQMAAEALYGVGSDTSSPIVTNKVPDLTAEFPGAPEKGFVPHQAANFPLFEDSGCSN